MSANKDNNVRSFVVSFAVFEDGRINRQKTIDKLTKAVDDYIANVEADRELVLASLNHLFDTNLGAHIDQQAIVGNVVRDIQNNNPHLANVSMYGQLANRVKEVLKDEIEAGRFVSKRGPGGTYRAKDQPKD
jgi:hypothetical protein